MHSKPNDEGVAIGSTDPRPTPNEVYDQKVRALVEKTKGHDYISPIEFRQLKKHTPGGFSSILKDCDTFETKEGVLIEWATLKYTGRKVKTFVSKVQSIPNPLPPSAFADYEPIGAVNFDTYLKPSGLTGLREVEWEEGPFDGVAIRLSGFWFARWGKVKGRGRVVSYVAMPTERYKEGQPTQQTTDEVDDWDEDDDEGEEVMIVEKPKKKLRQVGSNRYFRTYIDPDVVMVRVPNTGEIDHSPMDRLSPDLIPCVVIIDARNHRTIKPGTMFTYNPGKVRWLSPDVEVQGLELTECPEFTVEGP